MQAESSKGASGSSTNVAPAEESTSPERRSLSPVRSTRRTTSTAVIACRQCRTRKIRCDSTRPNCSNCARREDPCEYDPAPKRRGPDKKPGTRQRRCKKRPDEREGEEVALRRPIAPSSASTAAIQIALPSPALVPSPESVSPVQQRRSAERNESEKKPAKRQKVSHTHGQTTQQQHLSASDVGSSARYGMPTPTPASSSYGAYDVAPFARSAGYDLGLGGRQADLELGHRRDLDLGLGGNRQEVPHLGHRQSPPQGEHPQFPGLPSATVQAAQQGWWDAFLRSYTLRDIAEELNFLYNESSITLSFINVRFLLETLWSPTRYLTLQPAFILASMALAYLIQSSETGRGAAGRATAAFLRHSAQDALERAWRDAIWVDASLAEAALIIAIYESSAHPEYHPDRLARALTFLDEVLSTLNLTALDAGNPDVCRFARDAAPVVPAPAIDPRTTPCACVPTGTPAPERNSSMWASSSALPWDPNWSAREIRAEECRRVCWSALTLVTSFRAEGMALAPTDDMFLGLRICEPANYLLLFPNEMYDRNQSGFGSGRRQQDGNGGETGAAHPKNAIWALYCRSLLLANFCSNVTARHVESREERENLAEALQESWNEALAIQDALDAHVCGLHVAIGYVCRENIVNAQMVVTKALRNLQGLPAGNRPGPLFNRRQAEEWIYSQDEVLKRVIISIQYLSDPRGQHLTQRPFAVTWFYHQLAICLLLWENDTSLGEVLTLAKSFLVPLDVMNALWPCQLIQLQCAALRKRLAAHCRSAGHEPPSPSNYSLPTISSR
ncbi:hypothetical protein C8R43DRAFT_1072243 [Mycena crocata]|nr:hypothetical protein C8R43DRAFT_1072243 [Mycena crocata]